MAKHCTVCDRDYADELESCPRCSTARTTKMANRSEERTTQLADFQTERPDEPPTLDDGPLAAGASAKAGLDLAGVDKDSSAVNLGTSPDESGEDLWGKEAVEVVDVAADSAEASPASGHIEEVVEAVGDSGIDLSKLGQPPEASSATALEALLSDAPDVDADAVEAAMADSADSGVMAQQEAAEIRDDEDAMAAVDAEEEMAAVEAKEDEAAAKPVKQRSPILALAGSACAGVLIGVLGTIGARAMMGSGDKEKSPALSIVSPQAKQRPTFESQAARVASGDWDEAKTSGIEQVAGATPKELVARGQYHLGSYLKNVGSKINADDPALQPAMQDLKKAAEQGDANAVYDLAWIKELAGKLPEAQAEYAKGAQTFANDPEQKQRFESAILRVEWKAAMKVSGAAMLPPQRMEDGAVVLALLLTALEQQPAPQAQPAGQPAQPAAKEDNKEAGFDFWQAAKLAHEGKFSDAVRAIDRARKLHDERRFSRLRKAQNPLSDPAEDIFLRCCDELKTYWRLEARLRDGGYLTDKNTPTDALQALIQKADSSEATAKSITDKLVAAKVIGKDEDASKGLDRLLAEKQGGDAKLANLKTMLQTAKDESAMSNGKLTTAEKSLAERDAALTAAKKENENLKTSNGDMDATLKEIRNKLAEAKLLADAKGKANVVEAVKKAVDVAKSKDTQGMIRQQREEIARLSSSMKGSRPPAEMLPLWLLLLDEERDRVELANEAAKDVELVKMDPRATSALKGEAAIVLGLALRNSDQFSKAKMVLESARGMVDRGEWLVRADAALKDVSDPAAYFNAQAQNLYDRGRMDAALRVLERAMKVVPAKEQGKLLAQRSLIELDAARLKAKGTLPPSEPLLIAARRDAEEAVKAGLAAGHYAAGRIAEELGQVDAAIKSYRAALAAHGEKLDAESGRYRMALARVLLPHEAPARAAQKVGWRDPAPYPANHFKDMKNLVLMLALGLQPPLLPDADLGQEEAEKLADEVLKAPPGTVPFNVLAQALAVKGRWTAALRIYVEGIRPMLPREYGNGLVYLIANDPRLSRPDSLRTPNPMEAEKHFAAGLNFYFDRDYANAEKEFLLTVENDGQDARFFYFLGLSRLAQSRRRDAALDLEQGAMLERLNRPAPAAVNESMERVQGPMRSIVNEVRERPES